MTLLRDQFQSAARAYRSMSYPGDLAAELLPPTVRLRRPFPAFGALGVGAIAAAVVAAFLGRPLLTPGVVEPHHYLSMVKEIHVPRKVQFSLPSLPSLPDFSPHLSLAPAMRSLVPPDRWRLPSLDWIHIPGFSDKPEHA
jgi:hypothetical protein